MKGLNGNVVYNRSSILKLPFQFECVDKEVRNFADEGTETSNTSRQTEVRFARRGCRPIQNSSAPKTRANAPINPFKYHSEKMAIN
jgi:hypothetical protein